MTAHEIRVIELRGAVKQMIEQKLANRRAYAAATTATQKIRMVSGELVNARYIRHLRTLTGPPGQDNVDVDLYRTESGRTLVCTSPANDARAIPDVDPHATPEMYGVEP